MKERLVQLLDLEQLTPSRFADIIGVQRSSVSHVISGRNKPSFDFIEKTLKAFPGLNADWLILGKGTMYEHMGRTPSGTLFDPPVEAEEVPEDSGGSEDESTGIEPVENQVLPEDLPGKTEGKQEETKAGELPLSRKVAKVIVVYDDDTFSAYTPSQ